ncbi:uncharacterized protein BCR38DRAFT_528838 [Pseudomassariella vexata]|uniref:Fe2OG dioxygenase domain-containing protein n=1 Tax=Pseudomassariella vexata TaxID=1141098 RepID=A0A1Y2D8W5_9PEZI|nr:uncharacterized protein BCR38DRAFT_528838 [Pseudomassariella vexata]ORY55701.1 hypothetical protein BCR38DRAFT_528838 [Pseudomassariella vexata]
MATAAVLPPSATTKPSWKPIIVDSHPSLVGRDDFNPSKHLAFKKAPKTYTMKEIGLPEDQGISPIAVSEPFPLFTQEAVMRMRQEVLSQEVLDNCQYSSNLSHCQLRGFANKYAPFVYDVWKSPETLAIVSKIAGIDLVPEMDFEIAHINISVKTEEERQEELAAFRERAEYEADEGIAGCPWEDDKPIVDWHCDSYPFVCVTMLSDCTTMIGGETALRTGTGDIMKVRGPQMGCAVILQGRYIEHQALRALGTAERISMVTSFRPKCPKIRDDTVLTTVRPISNLSELYNQFSEYRLEILEERIRQQLKELREFNSTGRRVPTKKLKAFFEEQEKFLAHMNKEMVDDEQVVKGAIDDSHLLTKKDEALPRKRPRQT